MDKRVFSGKTKEEAINQAIIELQELEENLYIKELESTKGGLFKSKKVEIEVYTKEDIIDFIKKYLQKIVYDIGIGINLEIKKRDGNVYITIISDNNALLIGKNGRTMDALGTILKQAIYTKYGFYFNFILDVGEYKEKQQSHLEYMAKKLAREVEMTKIAVKLDPMNSYERRIIHNALTNNKKVTTESEGQEPQRYIIIKPVETEE